MGLSPRNSISDPVTIIAHYERQQMVVVLVFRSCASIWEIQTTCQAPGFFLVQPWLLRAYGQEILHIQV